MKRGLFINNKKAKDSIYESGYMVYQCLKLSNLYSFDYCEVSKDEREIAVGYDFYFFNYHPITMSWLQTRNLRQQLGYVITMILEVAPGDPFVLCPEKHFDLYIALDPTLKPLENMFPFPRPLEKVDFELPKQENDIPIIGTFGFATKGKGFQHVVEAVNREFERAIVKINIPYGDYVPNSKEYAFFLSDVCKQKAKPGIDVQVTHDFMSKKELIEWCAKNTLNCFLYDRNMPGLSATTDQAIVTERPLSVNNNPTFRHITHYLRPYPEMSLKKSIETSAEIVQQMKEDWSAENFCLRFEKIMDSRRLNALRTSDSKFLLPLKHNNFRDKLEKKAKKYKRRFKALLQFKSPRSKQSNEII